MYIQGTSNIHAPQSVRAPHRTAAPADSSATSSAPGVDELDISSEGNFISQARDLPEIRHDRVADIRAQIKSGEYETPEKLDLALSRLLDEIG